MKPDTFVQDPSRARDGLNMKPDQLAQDSSRAVDHFDDNLNMKPDRFVEDPSRDQKAATHNDDGRKTKSVVDDPNLDLHHMAPDQVPERLEDLDIFRPDPNSDEISRKDSNTPDVTLRKRSKNHPNLSSLFLDALERAERASKESVDSLQDERDPLQGSSSENDLTANPEATPLERLALCCSWLCGNPVPETQH
ncbi:hypothetical protein BVRB_027120 [Beta vulgaris subsp. vulgaris]|uniref:Uncharacterized protein n=1 Tax=Beta vulgaris subsp. vulgaris TaxID=3555 RepID=A0A0J8B1U1_BETVV|nr:hypothetical protein BVRB_027120 [Beta vulgaris subsp. vulgaris]